MNNDRYHYVVVGGGSAGCALANRLSADPNIRVLLIEAGPDIAPGSEPPEILDGFPLIAYFSRKYQWTGLKVNFQPPEGSNRGAHRPVHYEQGRVIGGGSAINGQFANRGAPEDYDEWSEFGLSGWGWQDVLPYFRKLETDRTFPGPLHGNDGPITISRIGQDRWQPFSNASAEVFGREGFDQLEDQNGAWQDGYFPVTISNDGKSRVSSAMGYLSADVRSRRNLTILCEATVHELTVETGPPARVTGVEVRTQTGITAFQSDEVIVSAGALHSPCLLMRAGIGPGDALRTMGIDVVADRPGVGANLQEHPSIVVSAYLHRKARHDFRLRRHIQLALRSSSGLDGCHDGDLFICPLSRSGWHGVGARLASYITILNKPYSRGEVRLVDARPETEPEVRFNLLSDPRDLARMCLAVREMRRFFGTAPVSGMTGKPFLAAYSEKVRKFSAYRPRNQYVMSVLGGLLDGPPWLRNRLIDKVLSEADPLDLLLAEDRSLERAVTSTAVGVWHASGTCRLGSERDPEAVVDTHGRVIGVKGLRVADASIIPVLMRGNTNIPSIMIGEKIAASILEGTAAPVATVGASP